MIIRDRGKRVTETKQEGGKQGHITRYNDGREGEGIYIYIYTYKRERDNEINSEQEREPRESEQ